MKKLIAVLTILMLVTVNSYAGGTPKCNASKSVHRSTKQMDDSSFGKHKANKGKKAKGDRHHNYNQ